MKRIPFKISVAVGLVLLAAVQAPAGEPIHVLVSNDDGIDSPGLAAIAGVIAADPAYRVTVIAPTSCRSTPSIPIRTLMFPMYQASHTGDSTRPYGS